MTLVDTMALYGTVACLSLLSHSSARWAFRSSQDVPRPRKLHNDTGKVERQAASFNTRSSTGWTLQKALDLMPILPRLLTSMWVWPSAAESQRSRCISWGWQSLQQRCTALHTKISCRWLRGFTPWNTFEVCQEFSIAFFVTNVYKDIILASHINQNSHSTWISHLLMLIGLTLQTVR